MTKQSNYNGTGASISLKGEYGALLRVLRHMKAGQQLSAGFVWLTRTYPGPLQFAIGGGGHGLDLHFTALVDSSQTQS